MNRQVGVVVLALSTLVTSAPPTLAHGGTTAHDDPEGDWAKKQENLWNGVPPQRYVGTSCPLTDLVSVDLEAVHEDDHDVPFNGTRVTMRFADLTASYTDCPLYDEADDPSFTFALNVQPTNHDEAWVYQRLNEELVRELPTLLVWRDGGFLGPACHDCWGGMDRAEGTVEMILPSFAAEPPYRHINAYATSAICREGQEQLPRGDFFGCTRNTYHSQEGAHVDVVPNLGEGEWSMYTDEEKDPVERLVYP